MRFVLSCGLALALSGFLAAADAPRTVPEATNYEKTSRYADVLAFCKNLAPQSPRVKLTTFGQSVEKRDLPLLTIAEPPVGSAEEAAKSGKLVVLAFANIHAGEVDGKEALLALARELALEKDPALLKDLVVLLVPILNADGNERMDEKNRPEQNGPPAVGIRENAQGLDLNRDFVKLESPEVRALVKLVTAWDPAVIIDCHTTNGSKHRFTLTYDGPRYPDTDLPLSRIVDREFLPEAGKKVKAATGFETGPYGNFNADRTKWTTYPALPRYGVQYFALRNRIGILSESYSYAPFKDRIAATHAFVKACFEVTAEKKAAVRKLIAPEPRAIIPLRTETVAFPDKRPILGYENDKPAKLDLEYVAQVKPAEVVKRPAAYLVPASYKNVIEALQRHGVRLEELREDIVLDIEAFQVQRVDVEAKPFQKHQLFSIGVKTQIARWKSPAGTIVVRTAQPLGELAAYLLEPHAEDGLVTWGFFVEDVVPGNDFPVRRLMTAPPLLTGSPRPLAEERTKDKPITEALLFGGGGRGFTFGFAGNPIATPEWLPDGEHFLQVKDGKLWKVEARTGTLAAFIDTEKYKQSIAAVAKSQADAISKRIPNRMNPDRTGALVESGGDLILAFFDGRPAVKLGKSDPAREYLSFAPTGDRLAFVRGGNLFSLGVVEPGEKQLTTDGGGEILNAKGDWVYEEEIFNRAGRAFWFSPDGSQIAYLRFDDAPVKKFNIVDAMSPFGRLEAYPYPKAGDPNPLVSLHVVPAAGGKPVRLALGDYKPDDLVISRVGWLPDSKTVFAYVQNRTQTWLDFVIWSSPESSPKKLFRDSTRAWIEDPGPPHFLKDGSFLFLSDRSGYRHLYLYNPKGTLKFAVTEGEWEVKDVLRVDAMEQQLYLTGVRKGDIRTHLFRAHLDGIALEWLNHSYGGTHQVALAPKGPLYIDRFTDNATPTQVHLGAVDKRIRTLDTNPAYEREEYKFGKFEAVSVPMPDGFKLAGTLVYPPDFDPKKKYPVWLFTYAGPHMPSVREGFGGGRILDQALAASGIIVFRVDPRSASGESAQAAWTAYKQLGVQELKDLEAAVAWLAKNPWVDSSRVGISGHSYGGFMAAYALTHSKTFSAGIASGPVTDWRLYDSIYTERYMLTPKENPAGYEKSSVIKAAKNLHGKLLIIHGMIDDNVHMQNSVQLADALQAAGKDFEMMFYPRSRHGIGSPHYLRLQIDFIRRTMGVK
jgi:dipeptidyl aminopeptidase/acylaminoacyl peptidase